MLRRLLAVVITAAMGATACAPLGEGGTPQATTTVTITPDPYYSASPPTFEASPLGGPISPGEAGRIQVDVDGEQRSFVLHVPDGYSADQEWPLLLAYHGYGQDAEQLRSLTRLDSAAALVAYPEGENRAWAPAPYAETSMAEDLAYSEALVATVDNLYAVDNDDISVLGYSNGGGMAAALACRIPDRISGVATVAAAYYEAVHEDCADTPVPHIDLHGTADQVVGYYGGRRHQTAYDSVDTVLNGVAKRNGCSGIVDVSRESLSTLSYRWQDCEERLEHVRIGGGGHTWPGGTADTNKELSEGYGTYRILRFLGVDWGMWQGD